MPELVLRLLENKIELARALLAQDFCAYVCTSDW
jgi:hypothetical protein